MLSRLLVQFQINVRLYSSRSKFTLKYKKKKSDTQYLQDLLLKMPKEEPHLKDIKKIRMEKRIKRYSTQPSTIYWQVLGNGTYGGPTSLFLHTDHRRYLFNCGEGTQRMTSQLSLSRALGQLEHVFITSNTWKYLGGLPGLCLSVRSAGAPDITVHGPRGCMDIYEATKGFLTLFDFDVESHTAEDGDFEDGGVKVEHVVLTREAGGREVPPLDRNWREDDYSQVDTHYQSDIQAYICHFSPRPGKLDINKCIELGVKPGPVLGKLKAGEDVVLESGQVIRSQEVVGQASPSKSFLVLDIPDINYLHNLDTCQKLENISNLDTVFHFSPEHIIHHVKYQQYCAKLGPDVRHVLLNESCQGLGMPDVMSYAHKLRMIRPDLFPQLNGNDCVSADDLNNRLKLDKEQLGFNFVRGLTGLKVNVRPHYDDQDSLDASGVVMFDENKSEVDLMEGEKVQKEDKEEYIKAFSEALNYAKNYEEIEKIVPTSDQQYPRVTFLGTGSSIPSKYRNVSCILMETAPDNFIMFDCGEGSLSQMVRMFGQHRTKEILVNMKCVYISHMHADHHLGLINIIQHRERALAELDTNIDKMYIVSTDKLLPFLTYYHYKFESILTQCQFVKCEWLILYNKIEPYTGEEILGEKHQKLFPDDLSQLLLQTGLAEFYTSRAIHCPNAFCVAIRTKDGYKISYSGDTRPCEKFREISLWEGAPDLLIHEATMEHFMMYDALIKKHSTFTEAIEEGRNMKAKFTLLTHFSQRYSKIPFLKEEIEGQENVGIAFDNMSISADKLNIIPSMYKPMSIWLADVIDELEENSVIYKQKNETVGSGFDLDDPELDAQFPSKRKLAEKLAKKHEDKQKWFLNFKRKRLLEKEEEEKT